MLLLIASLSASVALGFPTGSGACPAAKPAVGAPHLNKDEFKADSDIDLADAPQNFTLTLNGDSLNLAGGATVAFTIGQAHTLELSSEGPFKGFLIRMGPQPSVSEFLTDFTEALAPKDDSNVQVEQTHCVDNENVGGVSHTNANDKNKITATLQMDEPASDILVDITVVIANNGNKSEFYHTLLTMNAVDPTGAVAPAASGTSRTPTLVAFLVGCVSTVLFLSP